MGRRTRAKASEHNQLGVTFFQSRSIDLAIEQFIQATKRAPWVATYWLNLGVALLDRGKVDEAKTALDKSLKLNPQSQSAYFHLGQIHTKRGDDASSREAYLKVIDLNSSTDLARRARELTEGRCPHLIVQSEASTKGT